MSETLQDVTDFPSTAELSASVHRVLGMNPGVFTGPGTNTYLVGMGSHKPILIDTGSGVPAWMELLHGHLAARGVERPKRCLLTHGHPDHIGGIGQLRAAWPDLRLYKQPWPGRDEGLPSDMLPIADGDTFEGIGYTLRALHTPGHAPEHLCFYLEEERALFTGDVVLGVGTTVIPREGGDLGLYLDTLRRLLELDVQRIYPGHGPVIEDAKARITFYLEHRLERERQILDVLTSAPSAVEGIVETIYKDYPRNLFAAAGQSVSSHLDKLVAEGRVQHDSAASPVYRIV